MVGRKVQLDVAANIVKNGLGIIPSDFTKIMDSAFRGCNKETSSSKIP